MISGNLVRFNIAMSEYIRQTCDRVMSQEDVVALIGRLDLERLWNELSEEERRTWDIALPTGVLP